MTKKNTCTYVPVEPGPAKVSKGREACREKGKPIGTTPDRLAATAVDGVISWNSCPLTFLSLGALSSCQLVLIPSLCLDALLSSISFSLNFWCLHFCLIRLPFLFPAVCLGVFFSLTFFFLGFLFWWCHFLSIRFARFLSESWRDARHV